METTANVQQSEYKPEKCVLIGKKYFFFEGKYSINSRMIGLPITLILLIYDFIHVSVFMNKFLSSSSFTFLFIINLILFSLQILQSLNTAFTDPGSFLPNYGEDKSNSSEANLMIATIKGQDYFLKFCRTCGNAKDLRVYHCPDCGLCILRHDHHCPYLSNCIGLNNHKLFIYLIIINLIYFIINTILLLTFMLSKVNKDEFSELAKSENIFLYILLIFNAVLFLFNLALIINHIIYISTGKTTSERIKRKKGAINPFSCDTIKKNQIEFWKYPMKYRERIEYNEKASKFLDTNILINDYLSGNYYMSPDKKIISQTYINNGYNYNKASIELIDKSNESNREGGNTTDSVKLDEQGKNDI